MVAAFPTTNSNKTPQQNQSPSRPPLLPSEDNAGFLSKRPKARGISSRYLFTPSSSSSSSSVVSRRYPSPLVPRAPSSPDPSIKRSQSVGRSSRRSLSVSFQGESFSLPITKQKLSPMAADRSEAPQRGTANSSRWPAARQRGSIDFSNSKMEKIADYGWPSDVATSDTESVSSGSNSGVSDSAGGTPRGAILPARFPRLRNNGASPKLVPLQRVFSVSHVSSPRMSIDHSLRLGGCAQSALPSKLPTSPLVTRTPSPSRVRPWMAGSISSNNTPSFLSFASDARRGKMGGNRIEEAHLLRLLYNRHLQWRFTNTRANAGLSVQRLTAKRNLYNAWITTSELRNSVAVKRIQLLSQRQNLKLTTILKEQTSLLEDWAHLERDYSKSLSEAIVDLKAATLRLPVTDGAKAEIQKLKDAISSAADVMQAIGSSARSMVSKVEKMNSLVAELAQMAAQECAMLARCKDILTSVAAIQFHKLQKFMNRLRRLA